MIDKARARGSFTYSVKMPPVLLNFDT